MNRLLTIFAWLFKRKTEPTSPRSKHRRSLQVEPLENRLNFNADDVFECNRELVRYEDFEQGIVDSAKLTVSQDATGQQITVTDGQLQLFATANSNSRTHAVSTEGKEGGDPICGGRWEQHYVDGRRSDLEIYTQISNGTDFIRIVHLTDAHDMLIRLGGEYGSGDGARWHSQGGTIEIHEQDGNINILFNDELKQTIANQSIAPDSSFGARARHTGESGDGLGDRRLRLDNLAFYPHTPDVESIVNDGQNITVNAAVLNEADEHLRLAVELDGKFGFRMPNGNYYENWGGAGEKWLQSANESDTWYYLLPDGQLYRWHGATDPLAGDLLATFDASYHAVPAKLHDPPDPNRATQTGSVAQQAYNLDQQLGFSSNGNYYENWGGAGEKWLTAGSTWYYILSNGELYRWYAGTSNPLDGELIATLDANYHADPALLHDAPDPHAAPTPTPTPDPRPAAEIAHELDQQLGLYSNGNYYENWGGLGEKWLQAANDGDAWYYVLPNGELYRWNRGTNPLTGELIATLDASYHANPALLHDAPVYVPVGELLFSHTEPLGLAEKAPHFFGPELSATPEDPITVRTHFSFRESAGGFITSFTFERAVDDRNQLRHALSSYAYPRSNYPALILQAPITQDAQSRTQAISRQLPIGEPITMDTSYDGQTITNVLRHEGEIINTHSFAPDSNYQAFEVAVQNVAWDSLDKKVKLHALEIWQGAPPAVAVSEEIPTEERVAELRAELQTIEQALTSQDLDAPVTEELLLTETFDELELARWSELFGGVRAEGGLRLLGNGAAQFTPGFERQPGTELVFEADVFMNNDDGFGWSFEAPLGELAGPKVDISSRKHVGIHPHLRAISTNGGQYKARHIITDDRSLTEITLPNGQVETFDLPEPERAILYPAFYGWKNVYVQALTVTRRSADTLGQRRAALLHELHALDAATLAAPELPALPDRQVLEEAQLDNPEGRRAAWEQWTAAVQANIDTLLPHPLVVQQHIDAQRDILAHADAREAYANEVLQRVAQQAGDPAYQVTPYLHVQVKRGSYTFDVNHSHMPEGFTLHYEGRTIPVPTGNGTVEIGDLPGTPYNISRDLDVTQPDGTRQTLAVIKTYNRKTNRVSALERGLEFPELAYVPAVPAELRISTEQEAAARADVAAAQELRTATQETIANLERDLATTEEQLRTLAGSKVPYAKIHATALPPNRGDPVVKVKVTAPQEEVYVNISMGNRTYANGRVPFPAGSQEYEYTAMANRDHFTSNGSLSISLWADEEQTQLLASYYPRYARTGVSEITFETNEPQQAWDEWDTGMLVENPVPVEMHVLETIGPNALVVLSSPYDDNYMQLEQQPIPALGYADLEREGGTTGSTAWLTLDGRLPTGGYSVRSTVGPYKLPGAAVGFHWDKDAKTLTVNNPEHIFASQFDDISPESSLAGAAIERARSYTHDFTVSFPTLREHEAMKMYEEMRKRGELLLTEDEADELFFIKKRENPAGHDGNTFHTLFHSYRHGVGQTIREAVNIVMAFYEAGDIDEAYRRYDVQHALLGQLRYLQEIASYGIRVPEKDALLEESFRLGYDLIGTRVGSSEIATDWLVKASKRANLKPPKVKGHISDTAREHNRAIVLAAHGENSIELQEFDDAWNVIAHNIVNEPLPEEQVDSEESSIDGGTDNSALIVDVAYDESTDTWSIFTNANLPGDFFNSDLEGHYVQLAGAQFVDDGQEQTETYPDGVTIKLSGDYGLARMYARSVQYLRTESSTSLHDRLMGLRNGLKPHALETEFSFPLHMADTYWDGVEFDTETSDAIMGALWETIEYGSTREGWQEYGPSATVLGLGIIFKQAQLAAAITPDQAITLKQMLKDVTGGQLGEFYGVAYDVYHGNKDMVSDGFTTSFNELVALIKWLESGVSADDATHIIETGPGSILPLVNFE